MRPRKRICVSGDAYAGSTELLKMYIDLMTFMFYVHDLINCYAVRSIPHMRLLRGDAYASPRTHMRPLKY